MRGFPAGWGWGGKLEWTAALRPVTVSDSGHDGDVWTYLASIAGPPFLPQAPKALASIQTGPRFQGDTLKEHMSQLALFLKFLFYVGV